MYGNFGNRNAFNSAMFNAGPPPPPPGMFNTAQPNAWGMPNPNFNLNNSSTPEALSLPFNRSRS